MNPFIILLTVLAAFPAVALAITYALTAKWWINLLSRGFFLLTTCIATLMTLIVVTLFLGPDYPGRDAVRIFSYLYLVGAQWYLFITYLITVRRLRDRLAEKQKDLDD
jgi:ABC-type multidrug transport system fused ATPase/permease subunit